MRDCGLRSRALARAVSVGMWCAVALGSCTRDATAPAGGRRSFSLAPVFPVWFQQSQDSAAFTSVRAALTNVLGGVVADTTVSFPASADSIALQFPLPDTVAIAGEPVLALVWCINAAGDTVFKGGPVPVIVGTGRRVNATVIPLTYVGGGEGGGGGGGGGGGLVATALAIATQPVTTVAGTAVTLTVDAVDAAGAIVTNFTGAIAVALGSNSGGTALGGTLTATAVNGVATFSNVVLTKAASAYTLVATAGSLASATSHAFGISPAAPSAIVVSGGNNQTGPLSELLGTPLSVLVHDAYGNPVPGVNVAWAAVSGSGSLANATTLTDASGIATDGWTLGSVAGLQTVTATAAGLANAPVTFSATATGLLGAALITKQGGDNQSGILGLGGILLANPLTVLVTDVNGNPVSGTTVNWVVSAGNAALATASSTTNSNGIASNSVTLLGLVAGVSQVTASLGSTASVVFSETGVL